MPSGLKAYGGLQLGDGVSLARDSEVDLGTAVAIFGRFVDLPFSEFSASAPPSLGKGGSWISIARSSPRETVLVTDSQFSALSSRVAVRLFDGSSPTHGVLPKRLPSSQMDALDGFDVSAR